MMELQDNEFKKKLGVDTEILKLKKMYENGEITEDDLQISQIKKMIGIYKKSN